mmetsp:Transcript_24335/g.43987  ORF Transcript_24335/g.43987 Transcript_24335/m.43987 type:complete len:84 (+) Transcript_24335:224-475(+)
MGTPTKCALSVLKRWTLGSADAHLCPSCVIRSWDALLLSSIMKKVPHATHLRPHCFISRPKGETKHDGQRRSDDGRSLNLNTN